MSANIPRSKPEAKLDDNQDELADLQFVPQNANKDNYVYIDVANHAQV